MRLYQKLSNILPSAGLSEMEARVYIELLKSPVRTVWELVQRTSLSKSSVYRAIERLQSLTLVEKTSDGLRALSLRGLVSKLASSERTVRKAALKLREIDPLLKLPETSIGQIETFYTADQIAEAYLFISEQNFNVSLDIGDFEHFASHVGGVSVPVKFRNNRFKKGATSHAICTYPGPHTDYFCTEEARTKFRQRVDVRALQFDGNFISFTDESDYVLFSHFDDEAISGVLVQSRAIADAQRRQFSTISQANGNR